MAWREIGVYKNIFAFYRRLENVSKKGAWQERGGNKRNGGF